MDTNSGLWNDDNCGTFNGYICEKYPGASSIEIPATPIPVGGCPPSINNDFNFLRSFACEIVYQR